jgi:DNA polymerase III alpha subunit
MKTDQYSRQILSEDDLCDIFLRNPEHKLSTVLTDTVIHFHPDLELNNTFHTTEPTTQTISVSEFDDINQSTWFMPDEYKSMDIAKYLLDLCTSDEELQRVGKELILYQERNMFPLLRFCKYLVDTMRANNVVWGVGRGSSVSSYVLFLLGVHKINSIYYDLDVEEFLK